MKTLILFFLLVFSFLGCPLDQTIADTPYFSNPGEHGYSSKEVMPGAEYKGDKYKGFFLLHMFSSRERKSGDSAVLIPLINVPVTSSGTDAQDGSEVTPPTGTNSQGIALIPENVSIAPEISINANTAIAVTSNGETVEEEAAAIVATVEPAVSLIDSGEEAGSAAATLAVEQEVNVSSGPSVQALSNAPDPAQANSLLPAVLINAPTNAVAASKAAAAKAPQAEPALLLPDKRQGVISAADNLRLNAEMSVRKAQSNALSAAIPVDSVADIYGTNRVDWLDNLREYQSGTAQENNYTGYYKSGAAADEDNSGRIVRQPVLVIDPLKEVWYKVAYLAALQEEKELMFRKVDLRQGIVADTRLFDPLGALSSKTGEEQYYLSNAREEVSKLLSDPAVSNLYLNLE